MVNTGPTPTQQILTNYQVLRQLDPTLPAHLSPTNIVKGYIKAIAQVRNSQFNELGKLRAKYPQIVTRYVLLTQTAKYSTKLDDLVATSYAIDAINNEIIGTKIIQNKTKLNLNDCGITRIPASLFAIPTYYTFFNKLEHITCNNNPIRVLALKSLPSLKLIDAQECEIKILKLENLPALDDISVHDNCIEGSLDFRPFKSLNSIDVQNNKIEAIYVTGLEQLENLYCQDNQISQLTVDSPVIKDLNCRGNLIYRLNITHVDQLKLAKDVEAEETNEDEASSELAGLQFESNYLSSIPQNLVTRFGEEWAAEQMSDQHQLGIPQELLLDEMPPAMPAAAEILPHYQIRTRARPAAAETPDLKAELIRKFRRR